jgi:antitoxin VapB
LPKSRRESILRRTGHRAKLFQNGGSQAVRLPRECRFEGQDEVRVRRDGSRVILEPIDEWSETFRASLGAFTG